MPDQRSLLPRNFQRQLKEQQHAGLVVDLSGSAAVNRQRLVPVLFAHQPLVRSKCSTDLRRRESRPHRMSPNHCGVSALRLLQVSPIEVVKELNSQFRFQSEFQQATEA